MKNIEETKTNETLQDKVVRYVLDNNGRVETFTEHYTGGTGNFLRLVRYRVDLHHTFWGGFSTDKLSFTGDNIEQCFEKAWEFIIRNKFESRAL